MAAEGGGVAASLDAVHNEQNLHIGCLELFVRLARGSPRLRQQPAHGGNSAAQGGQEDRPASPPCFAVGEDGRQRALVRWCSSAGSAHAAHDQTWRVSCALAPGKPEGTLLDTLGHEAMEWLWDGLSALVLLVGPHGEDELAVPLFGRDMYANNGQGRETQGGTGLLMYCFEELTNRVTACGDPDRYCFGLSLWQLRGSEAEDLLAEPGEDAATELRFETVRFRNAPEARALLEAAGLLRRRRAAADSDDAGPELFQRSHVFVRLVVFDSQRESLAALHFAQVGCGGVAGDFTDVVADRRALWALLETASTGEPPEPKPGCRLSEVLAPLVAGNCKPFLLCTVPERPQSREALSEAHGLLDLAERASLITAQCSRVQGICRDDIQLAELDTVLERVRLGRPVARRLRIAPPSSRAPRAPGRPPALPAALARSPSRSPRHDIAGLGGPPEGLPLPASGPPPQNPAWVTAVARAGAINEEVLSGSEQRSLHLQGAADFAAASGGGLKAVSPAGRTWGDEVKAHARANCLEECCELDAACTALRARNDAKASRRARELQDVYTEIARLREATERVEDSCEAPAFLRAFREEALSLRAEAERLREENAALSGSRGQDRRRAAQRAVLHSLQAESLKLRHCAVDMEQSEKRAGLVHRCLEEVRTRLDLAKRRVVEADQDVLMLQPSYGELGSQIKQSEQQRRRLQEELDKLRRTADGLRAEINQLWEVRGTIGRPPLAEGRALATGGRAGGGRACSGGTGAAEAEPLGASPGSAGTERFAALQRRLAQAAPQLMPLCTRARAEMEDLAQCCRRLEERQRRLQQVSCTAAEQDAFSTGAAAGTSVGAACRARSSELRGGRERSVGGASAASGVTGAAASAGVSAVAAGRNTPRSVGAAARAVGSPARRPPPAHEDDYVPAYGGYAPSSAPVPEPAVTPRGHAPRATVSMAPQSASTTPRSAQAFHPVTRDTSPRSSAPMVSARGRAASVEGYAKAWARGRSQETVGAAPADAGAPSRPRSAASVPGGSAPWPGPPAQPAFEPPSRIGARGESPGRAGPGLGARPSARRLVPNGAEQAGARPLSASRSLLGRL